MDPIQESPSSDSIEKDHQLESSKLAADDGSSKTPVFNDGKLLVKLKIPKSREEIEEGEIVSPVVMKNHQCSECSKIFHSGKALGGHMSSAHVQAGKDYYNKKMKLKKSMKFKHHGGSTSSADTGGAMNVCSICGKNFPSRKSLFGHMRCHPDRDWRGMEPPPMEAKKIALSALSDDDDYESLETVYLNDSAAVAMVVTSPVVDLTDSLISWTVKGQRGHKGLEPTNDSPQHPPLPCLEEKVEEEEELCKGLELLVNVASVDSLNSSQTQEEVEAMGSNSPTLNAEIQDVNGISKSMRQRMEVDPANETKRIAEIQDLNRSSKSEMRKRSEVNQKLDRREFPVTELKFSERKFNAGIEDLNGASKPKSQKSEQELYRATDRRDSPMRSLKISQRRPKDASELKGKGEKAGKAPRDPQFTGSTYQSKEMARMEPELAAMIYNGKGKISTEPKFMTMVYQGEGNKALKEHKFTGMGHQGKGNAPIESEFTGMTYGGRGMALMKPGFTGMNRNGKGKDPSESESTESEDKGYLNGTCSADESDSMNTDDLQQQHRKYSEGNQIKVRVKNKKRGENFKPVNLEPAEGDYARPAAQDSDAAATATEKHICSTCHKSFPSHQALGGHRSSHNKFRVSIQNAIDEYSPKNHANSVSQLFEVKEGSESAAAAAGSKSVENAYKCKICNKNFPTGQALGGHKRCHWTGSSSQAAAPEEDTQSARKVLKFDLNEMPDMEDGDGKDSENDGSHGS